MKECSVCHKEIPVSHENCPHCVADAIQKVTKGLRDSQIKKLDDIYGG